MKIAISNIAWQAQEEESIAQIMQSLNIKGVEIAPTKICNSPLAATNAEIESYKKFWQSREIEIVAMQALLFGRPDLTIFLDAEKRKETLDYLSGTIELGSKLGAKSLIFGSPNNRRIENLSWEEAEEIAVSFFFYLGEVAAKYGMKFCIEPNPIVYNCNFINTSQEALGLVKKVNSDGFGLHLDAAAMSLNGEAVQPTLLECFDRMCHFHISEPFLAPVGEGKVDHKSFANILAELNYQGWKSIEMKAQNPDSNIENVTEALKTAIQYYGCD
jgi:sugar phosphate isomerase/epimerase